MPRTNIIQQGAEAIIIHEDGKVIKDRVSKSYRHPELDKKLIKARTKREAKILEKASKIIDAPKPISVSFNEIQMPFIEGKKLSENLENLNWREICKKIGKQIAKLHDNNIIHGDLTTSNMIWVENSNQILKKSKSNPKPPRNLINNNLKNINNSKVSEQEEIAKEAIYSSKQASDSEPRLFFIDFGLGFESSKIEDRAVDLHLIKQALEAKHFSIHKEAEKIILNNYDSKDKEKVLEQLKKVELRGRYKH
jgi:TP53 regulating kinase-like protein